SAPGWSSTWAIWARCGGQMSGQFVYPKNRRVMTPSVSARKSKGFPSVSVSTKSGFSVGSASATAWKGPDVAPSVASVSEFADESLVHAAASSARTRTARTERSRVTTLLGSVPPIMARPAPVPAVGVTPVTGRPGRVESRSELDVADVDRRVGQPALDEVGEVLSEVHRQGGDIAREQLLEAPPLRPAEGEGFEGLEVRGLDRLLDAAPGHVHPLTLVEPVRPELELGVGDPHARADLGAGDAGLLVELAGRCGLTRLTRVLAAPGDLPPRALRGVGGVRGAQEQHPLRGVDEDDPGGPEAAPAVVGHP